MKRLIFLTAAIGSIVLASILLIRWGPGGVPVQAQEPPPPSTPAQQLVQAEQLRFQLKWDEAIALLRQVASQGEDRASAAMAQVRIGKYLVDQRRADEAEPELTKVLATFGDRPEAVFWGKLYLIEVMRVRSKESEAQAAAQAIVDDSTLTPQQRAWGRVKHAETLFVQGLRQTAAEELRQTIASAGDDPSEPHNWARVRLAELAAHEWLPEQAVALADAVVADHGRARATDQQLAWALFWKAFVQIRQKHPEQAIASLSMATAVAAGKYPDINYELEMGLGGAYRLSSQVATAVQHYRAAYVQAVEAKLTNGEAGGACLQLAGEWERQGMRERAIAWLRMGIRDPAKFARGDETLSERLVSLVTPVEAEAWHRYLLAPTQTPDPTNAYVLAEFKAGPPSASSTSVDSLSSRQFWLGRLYEKQKRVPEAKAAFSQALTSATTPRERAEALSGSARAFNAESKQSAAEGRRDAAAASFAQARQAAEQATAVWLGLSMQGSCGDSHYANEQAVELYWSLHLSKDALTVADYFLTQLTGSGAPASKRAFASMTRIRALAWNQRLSEAIEAAVEMDDQYPQDEGLGFSTIRTVTLLRASSCCDRLGDPARGLALLDRLRARYGNDYDQRVTDRRRSLSEKLDGVP